MTPPSIATSARRARRPRPVDHEPAPDHQIVHGGTVPAGRRRGSACGRQRRSGGLARRRPSTQPRQARSRTLRVLEHEVVDHPSPPEREEVGELVLVGLGRSMVERISTWADSAGSPRRAGDHREPPDLEPGIGKQAQEPLEPGAQVGAATNALAPSGVSPANVACRWDGTGRAGVEVAVLEPVGGPGGTGVAVMESDDHGAPSVRLEIRQCLSRLGRS